MENSIFTEISNHLKTLKNDVEDYILDSLDFQGELKTSSEDLLLSSKAIEDLNQTIIEAITTTLQANPNATNSEIVNSIADRVTSDGVISKESVTDNADIIQAIDNLRDDLNEQMRDSINVTESTNTNLMNQILKERITSEDEHVGKILSQISSEINSARLLSEQSKNKSLEFYKTQKESLKKMFTPGGLLKSVGFSVGSPGVAFLGEYIDKISEKIKESSKENASEYQKLNTLLSENNIDSEKITNILEATKTLDGTNTDEINKILRENGIQNKEIYDNFKIIKSKSDEKLLARNYDIVSQLKEQGYTDETIASELRRLHYDNMDKSENSYRSEEIQDRNTRLLESQTESQSRMSGYLGNIQDTMSEMVSDLKSKGLGGLGVIAGLIAAPFFALVGFFQGLKDSIRTINEFTNGGLSKIFEPIKKIFTNIKGFFSRFEIIGETFSKIKNFFVPVIDVVKKIKTFFMSFYEFAGAFSKITSIASKVGKVVGKIFPFFNIFMGIWDSVSGFMDGFKEGGIIGGIKGAINGLFDGLIGGLIDLAGNALAWILDLFGFENAANFIRDGKDKLLAGIKDGINMLVDFITFIPKKIFNGISNIFSGFFDLFKGIFTLDGGLISSSLSSIFGGLLDILYAPIDMFIDLVKNLFSFAGIDLPDFSISEFLKGVVGDAINSVKSFFGFGDDKTDNIKNESVTASEKILTPGKPLVKNNLVNGFVGNDKRTTDEWNNIVRNDKRTTDEWNNIVGNDKRTTDELSEIKNERISVKNNLVNGFLGNDKRTTDEWNNIVRNDKTNIDKLGEIKNERISVKNDKNSYSKINSISNMAKESVYEKGKSTNVNNTNNNNNIITSNNIIQPVDMTVMSDERSLSLAGRF